MRHEHPVGRPQGHRQRLEQLQVRLVDFRPEPRPVGAPHALLEQGVEVLVGLEHRPPGPLGHLVVARQVVHLLGELHLEGREQVHHLVRLVPAGRVAELPVDRLLHDEVPGRLVGQVGEFEQDLEVRYVAVQVAGDEHVGAVLQVHDVAPAARGGPHEHDRLAKVRQHPVRGGHRRSGLAGGERRNCSSSGRPGRAMKGAGGGGTGTGATGPGRVKAIKAIKITTVPN